MMITYLSVFWNVIATKEYYRPQGAFGSESRELIESHPIRISVESRRVINCTPLSSLYVAINEMLLDVALAFYLR
jgi:hypothetical protein